MSRIHASLLILLTAGVGMHVHGQPASSPSSEIPMADYLALLAQIAPAAREGAEAYLQAFEQRCGHALTTAQLRRAMSEGSGDPVLMGMIRARQLRDANTVGDLARRIDCGRPR